MQLRSVVAGCVGVFSVFATKLVKAQDNTLDLRFVEINDKGQRTYANFIYARMLDSGRVLLEAYHLLLPQTSYRETSVGVGYRVLASGPTSVYALAHYGTTSDHDYFQPAVFAFTRAGRWSGDAFGMYYVPLGSHGVGQALVDPVEVMYRVVGPLEIGVSTYYYYPAGGPSVLKNGAQLGLLLGHFTPSIAVRQVNHGGGVQYQFRAVSTF
jgi:hypothetical protein